MSDSKHLALNTQRIELAATPVGYFALAGVWFAIAALLGVAIARKSMPTANDWVGFATTASVGIGWVLWLRGFQVRIVDGTLVYRDGFYRYTTLPLSSLRRGKLTWVEWKRFRSVIKVPRIVIWYGDSSTLLINPKPFSRKGVRLLLDVIRQCEASTELRPHGPS